MIEVQVLSKIDCPLCDKAVAVIEQLKEEASFRLTIIDIYQDDILLEKYQLMIPVVVIDGEEVDFGQVSKGKVKKRLAQKAEDISKGPKTTF